ncbi:MAG: fructosamine kinase family protein [Lewinellaceae bacterium]|nr:fructosamine kinase family protein [Lewinellaceae bacterium]
MGEIFSPFIRDACVPYLPAPLISYQVLSGGDISKAIKLSTSAGDFFLKWNTHPEALAMFQAEAAGLQAISAASHLRIPEMLACKQASAHSAFLLLEFIPSENPKVLFWENLGLGMAQLHHIQASQFGFATDNFIGSLSQYNTPSTSFSAFYGEYRLLPQMALARQQGYLGKHESEILDRIVKNLPSLIPEEQPSLIHGDFWRGNILVGPNQQAILIDPAVAYAHRELDLAMAHLFGGFASRFFEAYAAHFPLTPGAENRRTLFQLYFLLVHVNLFGFAYTSQVREILRIWA